ncbi:MAG TPA: ATP-binding cassette domain-containing protein [Acidimicrobiales bacterium]|nr:ATP-binding cassette domain-containing protein [Acidimicrobiales bacterium]
MIEVQPDLEVDGLTVQFGGLVAVNGVTLNAGAGSVTGLIGPNGAGKTTIFNACTGVVPCHAGSVRLGPHDLGHLSTAGRASHGLGRTFQRMELFDSMNVTENVALGPEAFLAARRPWSQLACARNQRRDIRARTKEALDRCGIAPMGRQRVGDLSTGQRRLVELARAMATPFHFLLLDEPSSGLDVVETERFGQIISRFVAETGIGILLVEHDMALVSGVCSYIYVLDFGNLIFQGPCAEVLSSETVRAAYLGSDAISEGEASQVASRA